MFKKLRSDRDPARTVFDEVRNEFGKYVTKAGEAFQSFILKYPKMVYVFMVALILISAAFMFTDTLHNVNDKVETNQPVQKNAFSPLGGFGQIMETTDALQETYRLKSTVERLLHKNHLSAQDSLILEHALDRMNEIDGQLKLKP
ncbi:hypothetical protein EOD41_14815 [Mucilaginibacter limnophilus]|uniref:Uncharacterized protein n=1 Tax=Mucilaginibacter limnophilus TaxID=1932778 RepID=A0A437MQ30_9SPHI|nr:hypothetical protein [Mucilaginibacter limnophilus]RVT99715.1 hypothetical protein EOD41_14815 [Mucilaginibacter limnophilus]